MSANSLRQRLLASSLIVGAALAASGGAAYAQASAGSTTVAQASDAGAPPEAAAVQEVVVTGSRIARPNLTGVSPVTIIGGPELQIQGHPSVEQVLRELPSTLGDGDNDSVNNGTSGIATIDLRGLGDQRTLVLVDGKRLAPTTNQYQVDLNQIPSQLLERVDVLTGGASSVYGGDAVSGVVNLILKKNFEGAQISADERFAGQGDALTQSYTMLLGVNSQDHKGNLTLYGEYTERNPLLQGARPYSAVTLASPYLGPCDPTGAQNVYGGFCTAGSGGIAEGRDTLVKGMFTADRTLVPYDNRTYNFAPTNYYQTGNNRYNFGATGHYEFNSHADVYTRLTFTDSDTKSQLAPTPVNQNFLVNYGNPLISTQERNLIFADADCAQGAAGIAGCGPNDTANLLLRRRLVENGNRDEEDTYTDYQAVLGVRGDIAYGWKYDVSGQYSRSRYSQRLTGDASQTRFQDGLLVNADGTCSSGNTGCVPVDIFQTNSISAAAANYFTLGLDTIGNVEEADVQGSATGEIPVQSPFAASKVGLSFGGEWRRESSDYEPDDNVQTGNLLGFSPSPAVKGSYHVSEIFGETKIPLVENLPFVKSLELNGGYRFSTYSTSGSVQSYTADIQWQTTQDLRFRASYSRSVREPNVSELFSPPQSSADSGTDPCGSTTSGSGETIHATASSALCIATGVPAQNYSTSILDCQGQCNSVHTGNSALSPEIGVTQSFGFVLTPRFLPGFTGTIDFYNIKIKQAIFIRPLQQVFDFCYTAAANPTQDPNNPFCQLIQRDQFGTVTTTDSSVNLQEANIGYLSQRGVDVDFTYRRRFSDFGLPSSLGGLELNLAGTFVDKAGFLSSPTSPYTNCLGKYGLVCGVPQPTWRHNLRLTWTDASGAISVSGRWRHIGGVRDDSITQYSDDPLDAKIGNYDYADFAVNWRVMDTMTVSAGVNNAFDKDPPLVDGQYVAGAAYVSGNTFPGTYDAIGRVVFVSATKKF